MTGGSASGCPWTVGNDVGTIPPAAGAVVDCPRWLGSATVVVVVLEAVVFEPPLESHPASTSVRAIAPTAAARIAACRLVTSPPPGRGDEARCDRSRLPTPGCDQRDRRAVDDASPTPSG